nr:methylmalonyl-CoA mutase family protein [Desulfosporosinus lacus]
MVKEKVLKPSIILRNVRPDNYNALRITESTEVEKALNELRIACREGKNVMEYTVNCARAGCTVGEQWKIFKEVFGLWKRPGVF